MQSISATPLTTCLWGCKSLGTSDKILAFAGQTNIVLLSLLGPQACSACVQKVGVITGVHQVVLLNQESYLKHSLACIIELTNCSCLVYNSTANDVSNVQKMLCGCWQNFLDIFFCAFCNTTQMQSCQTMHRKASNKYQWAKRHLLYLAIACPD